MKKWLCMLLLTACQSIPDSANVQELKLIRYQNGYGERQMPVARSAGEQRTQAWQKWLQAHRHGWQQQTVSGQTIWCAQWLAQQQTQRLCLRGTQTLVWFGVGVLDDAQAVADAQKIWQGR